MGTNPLSNIGTGIQRSIKSIADKPAQLFKTISLVRKGATQRTSKLAVMAKLAFKATGFKVPASRPPPQNTEAQQAGIQGMQTKAVEVKNPPKMIKANMKRMSQSKDLFNKKELPSLPSTPSPKNTSLETEKSKVSSSGGTSASIEPGSVKEKQIGEVGLSEKRFGNGVDKLIKSFVEAGKIEYMPVMTALDDIEKISSKLCEELEGKSGSEQLEVLTKFINSEGGDFDKMARSYTRFAKNYSKVVGSSQRDFGAIQSKATKEGKPGPFDLNNGGDNAAHPMIVMQRPARMKDLMGAILKGLPEQSGQSGEVQEAFDKLAVFAKNFNDSIQ